MKLVLVERPDNTAMEQVWVGDYTTAIEGNYGFHQEMPDKKAEAYGKPGSWESMRYPAETMEADASYVNKYYHIIPDTTDPATGVNTLYVYGEADEMGSTIGVDGKTVNADHIAEAKAAGAAHSAAKRTLAGLELAAENLSASDENLAADVRQQELDDMRL